MRRTRAEVALGRDLRVGQDCMRRDDGTVWHVRQVHRADCTAELQRGPERRQVGFAELRARWTRVTEKPWPAT